MYALKDIDNGDYVTKPTSSGFDITYKQGEAQKWDSIEELIEDITETASESGETFVGYSIVKFTEPKAGYDEEVL